MKGTARELEDMVLYQIGALAAIAGAEGVRLQHVKAHGALYNMSARDPELAGAIARAVAAFDKSLILFQGKTLHRGTGSSTGEWFSANAGGPRSGRGRDSQRRHGAGGRRGCRRGP